MLRRRLIRAAICLALAAMTPATLRAKDDPPPDIILIMADDLGFSDIGCYGSEIPTPHIDALADQGISFTQFRNTSRCCPSRAALLTGVYSHQAGIGEMNTRNAGPGNRGQLAPQVPTIAERLKLAGYATGMVGKWHLTMSRTIDQGPNGSWPFDRGFDYFYGTMEGAKNYFAPKWLFRNERPVTEFEENYFYTDALAKEASGFIRSTPKDKPLFLYAAFYAPHFPLQAPEETIAKFRGRYISGWDKMRETRFLRQKQIGVINRRTELPPRPADIPAWDTLSGEQRMKLDERMAIYAAQVYRLDQGVGRIIKTLENAERLDNAWIIFLSDNGATNSGGKSGAGRQDLLGGPRAQLRSTYGSGWAHLSNTPFRHFKANMHEGGVRAPLIVQPPKSKRRNFPRFCRDRAHIIDLTPTCLVFAGLDNAVHTSPADAPPFVGRNLFHSVNYATIFIAPNYFEHLGSQAIIHRDWKLVRSKRNQPWSLYSVRGDPTELTDRAQRNPDVVEHMSRLWLNWANRVHVLNPGGPEHFPPPYEGVVIDDEQARLTGSWKRGNRFPGHHGRGYMFAEPDSNAEAAFEWTPNHSEKLEIQIFITPHPDYGPTVPVTVHSGARRHIRTVNMRHPEALVDGRVSLGIFDCEAGDAVRVVIGSRNAGGRPRADAVQFRPLGNR